MKPDSKPKLGPAGIRANIAHLEHRVQTAHDNWHCELNELQYWLDELNKITPDDSSVTTAEGMTPSFCTVKGGVQ
ncbi:hypothetical protein UFOVP389_40 [uncultured Caudovirales phage]|uniref:Uncharacterized protein n=1 Tax=uncultured Caudovirales phage TaxID=2100421 RepID=A0A6J7X519_9CAUD|nr:hypothetical protein UFOVP389_40 [uncultured Caudovirales phage]